MSARARKQVRETEKFVRLLTAIQTQIEYTLMPTDKLLKTLCESAEFCDFSFVHTVKSRFDTGESLEDAWNGALKTYTVHSALEGGEIDLISAFSSAFGNTDKKGQSANCAFFIEQLEEKAKELRKTSQNTSRLYQALGVLSGVFLVILLF